MAKCASFHLKCEALGLKDPMDLRWAYEAVDDILPTVLAVEANTPSSICYIVLSFKKLYAVFLTSVLIIFARLAPFLCLAFCCLACPPPLYLL